MVIETLQSIDIINSTEINQNQLYNRKVIPEKYFVAPKYKLATCAVHKSFSAMITSILCYLDDEKEFFKKYNHLADFTFKFKRCVDKKNNNLGSFNELVKIHGKNDKDNFLNNWKVIMIIRNPIERFISGFVHFCYYRHYSSTGKMCMNCGNNYICYVNKLTNILNSNYTKIVKTPQPVKLHFFPQTM
ncbi:Sulfotransferase family and P-loop containing nucleoside triphosphate hydrolase domain-containing protein [Strongyloides ratti]|uniref:Sulfotransferase family and P-loop containing nucleoside triphosphate hydrolase domain-containing protein n=1 Tax=Strongyloides ratti TaxID=34506 RepID=A0A090LQW1_STRRB|nr:Sulfotransferase family and P-loop containing nucleoside triphosphate hydrolase domain-containing protein [Strongyloides ratti]CEF69986.1 Sulfotransferase family and P-loop containing nucleoside triphosphate hydrolase domain-containing protein [Strongyloides ratti]